MVKRDLNTDFTLNNCLFGSVKLTKNAEPDKLGYSGYGIGFLILWYFSFYWKWYELICAYWLKTKDILILGKGPIQE